MVKTNNTTKASSPKSDAERQKTRREKLREQIGPSVALHMSDHDKKRLNQVAEKITGLYQPGTHVRSRVIAELVNQYYMSYVMHRSGKTAKYIYEKYLEIWEMRFVDKMDYADITEFMNDNKFLVPTEKKDGSISLEEREWHKPDVLLYRKARNVINMIEKSSRSKRN